MIFSAHASYAHKLKDAETIGRTIKKQQRLASSSSGSEASVPASSLQPPKFASKSKPKPAAHTVAGQKQSLERALKQAAASIEKPREKPRKKPREKPREEFESEFESEPETEPESDQSSVSSLDSVEEMASEVSSESFVIIRPTRGCLTCFSFCRSHHFASSVTFRFVRAVLMTDESSSSS